jgi:hypothetical protein
MIDWSKLKSYKGDKYRSFEELCYQVAKGLYGQEGQFTPIDDSGGGDGVEFYMTLPNGDQWGWQAKFYYPGLRLSEGNRKRAIKDSLRRACEKHPRLRKWILCTPTNFTPDEQSWFESTLPQSVLRDMDVQLVHWGDSDFNNWLSEPRFSGKKHYFFGELELGFDWFRCQVDKQIAAIRDKFNPFLHTETSVDARIHELLGDEAFTIYIKERIIELEGQLEEYRKAVTDLNSRGLYNIEWGSVKLDLLVAAKPLQEALASALIQLQQTRELLSEQRLDEVQLLDWNPVWTQIEQAYDAYKDMESAFDISKLAYTGKDGDR